MFKFFVLDDTEAAEVYVEKKIPPQINKKLEKIRTKRQHGGEKIRQTKDQVRKLIEKRKFHSIKRVELAEDQDESSEEMKEELSHGTIKTHIKQIIESEKQKPDAQQVTSEEKDAEVQEVQGKIELFSQEKTL